MKVIGTMSDGANANGVFTLYTKGNSIPVVGVSESFLGKRVAIRGAPAWNDTTGTSYFRVDECVETTEGDSNTVEVSGVILGIMPEKKNARNRRSACLLIRQSETFASTVLVTALSANVDLMDTDNLSVGDRISIGGYICYHGKGLHVLYVKTIAKGGEKNA